MDNLRSECILCQSESPHNSKIYKRIKENIIKSLGKRIEALVAPSCAKMLALGKDDIIFAVINL